MRDENDKQFVKDFLLKDTSREFISFSSEHEYSLDDKGNNDDGEYPSISFTMSNFEIDELLGFVDAYFFNINNLDRYLLDGLSEGGFDACDAIEYLYDQEHLGIDSETTILFISKIIITHDYLRGMGYGSRLLKAFINHCKDTFSNDILIVLLSSPLDYGDGLSDKELDELSEKLNSFYRKLGFENAMSSEFIKEIQTVDPDFVGTPKIFYYRQPLEFLDEQD